MMDLMEKPDWARKLLDICTNLIIDWLKAQTRALGPTVEGFLLLDDIVGFVGEEHYKEFCHPCLKRICDAFPKDWIKIYHNDASIEACLEHLPDAGFNVLNWGKQTDIAKVRSRVGGRICLMGNVNPLETGVRGTPAQVRAATLDVLEKSGGRGIILSVGGGVSPGMPRANILAMQEALAEYNAGLVCAATK
jgi:uroporphyrinogen decarboxylase